MLRYEGLLTPYSSPTNNKVDYSGVNDLANQFQQMAQAKQHREDVLAQQAIDNAREQSAQEGKNKWYDSEAATNRLKVEQAKDAATEKRSSALFDAFRKAKTASVRQQIRAELERNGFTVEESASGLPAIASATESPNVAPPAVPSPKSGAKGPKVSPKFAAALGDFMANENEGTVRPEAQPEGGLGGTMSLLGMPGAGATSDGTGASSDQEGIAPPSNGKGKFTIKDKAGVTVHEYDEPLEQAQREMGMRQILSPILSAAKTDRERAAGEAAVRSGTSLAGQGVDPDKAAAYAMKNVYEPLLNGEFKKTAIPGSGGGGGGLGKAEVGRLQGVEMATQRVIQNESSRNKVAALNSRVQEIDNGEKLLDTGGFGQTSAALAWLKASTGRAPQQEFKALMNTQSVWGRLEQLMQKADPNAPLSDEMVNQMRVAFAKTRAAAKKDLEDVGSSAEQELLHSAIPFKDESERKKQGSRVRGSITGNFNRDNQAELEQLLGPK